MKTEVKEATVDEIGEFLEAVHKGDKQKILAIQEQFCEMVFDEIKKNPVNLKYSHTFQNSPDTCRIMVYSANITVSGRSVQLDLCCVEIYLRPFVMKLFLSCSSLLIRNKNILQRENLCGTFKADLKNVLLEYKENPGEI